MNLERLEKRVISNELSQGNQIKCASLSECGSQKGGGAKMIADVES